jgi:hypothetical protein
MLILFYLFHNHFLYLHSMFDYQYNLMGHRHGNCSGFLDAIKESNELVPIL